MLSASFEEKNQCNWVININDDFMTLLGNLKFSKILWFLTVTFSCCPYLYFGSSIM